MIYKMYVNNNNNNNRKIDYIFLWIFTKEKKPVLQREEKIKGKNL